MKVWIKILLYIFIAIVFAFFIRDCFVIIEGKKNKKSSSDPYASDNNTILNKITAYHELHNQSGVLAGEMCCDASTVPKYPENVCSIVSSTGLQDLEASCNSINGIIWNDSSNHCWYSAHKRELIDDSVMTTIPQQYSCPSGGTLTSNICISTGNPCTFRNKYTPDSKSYPDPPVSTVLTINNGYVFDHINVAGDVSFNKDYSTISSAPFLF